MLIVMEVIVDCDGSHCGQWWKPLLIVVEVIVDSGGSQC